MSSAVRDDTGRFDFGKPYLVCDVPSTTRVGGKTVEIVLTRHARCSDKALADEAACAAANRTWTPRAERKLTHDATVCQAPYFKGQCPTEFYGMQGEFCVRCPTYPRDDGTKAFSDAVVFIISELYFVWSRF